MTASMSLLVAPRGRHGEGREAGLDERQRPVDEVGRGVRVGQHVGQLLELQRPLARRGVVVAATEHDAAVQGRLVGRDAPGLALLVERRGQGVGQAAEVVRARGRSPARPAVEHGQHDQRRRVRLGGRHGPLGAGPQVEVMLRGGGHVRAGRVGDGQRQGALRARRRG